MALPDVITIDGPAASGKSTLGQMLASRLGYLYFDTGVLYRALTALALRTETSPSDEQGLIALARSSHIEVAPPTADDGRQYTVYANGEDITWLLRDKAVERCVSEISRHPGVRTVLRDEQRRIGLAGKVVMVGRDIGSVIMPDAGLKIFLEASVEERARRRCDEVQARGGSASYDEVLEDVRRRDSLDRQNTFLPANAIVLQSDTSTPPQLVEIILEHLAGQEREAER